ncbi:hypothetical protein DT075_37195 [Bacillus licheniformis]|nr:hypothetical protein DT075_37195 [Bacillus licheniformis]
MRRLQSLEAIEKVKNGDYHVLRDAEWLKYLVLTEEQNINLERISSLENMPQNPVFLYVEQTLQKLPLERIAEPEDIALLICALLEQETVTGQILTADCGQTL